ncbi:unnamed protein product, partial [Ixodes hexagonus]
LWSGARATRAFLWCFSHRLPAFGPFSETPVRTVRQGHEEVGAPDERQRAGVPLISSRNLTDTASPSVMSKQQIYVLSRIPNLGHQLTNTLKDDASVVDITAKFTIQEGEPKIKPEVVERLQSAEILITDANILKGMLYQLPNMKWVQLTSAGVDNLLPHLDNSRPPPRYTIARATGFGVLMAEYVVAGIINFERGLYKYYDHQKRKEWSDDIPLNFRTLSDLTIGILGTGVIGEKIASTLKKFGTKVHGLARRSRSLEELAQLPFEMIHSELSELLKTSDYIVNVLPSTPSTIGMLNGEVLKQCQRKPVFINMGRGTIIDDESIIKALNNGWISGAILDVFTTEPLPADSPLWNTPSVFITPHTSGPSRSNEIVKSFMQNFENFTRGAPLLHTFSFASGY